jgi:hypothetical protein
MCRYLCYRLPLDLCSALVATTCTTVVIIARMPKESSAGDCCSWFSVTHAFSDVGHPRSSGVTLRGRKHRIQVVLLRTKGDHYRGVASATTTGHTG